jgi:hypothetical protein
VDEFKTMFLGGSRAPGGAPRPGEAVELGEPQSPETLSTE